jgi:hypothetical protein
MTQSGTSTAINSTGMNVRFELVSSHDGVQEYKMVDADTGRSMATIKWGVTPARVTIQQGTKTV